MNDSDAKIATPPQDVFSAKPSSRGMVHKGARFHVYLRTETPPEGGIFTYFQGVKYPRKGFPYLEAMVANNHMKKAVKMWTALAQGPLALPILAFALLPWSLKAKALRRIADGFLEFADYVYDPHYLLPERYCTAAREIWRLSAIFANELGMTPLQSDRIGRALATMFEYDDSYRLFAQDLAGETDGHRMAANPRKEIAKLGQIFFDRDAEWRLIHSRRVGTFVRSFAKMVSLLFLHPRVRRSLRRAIGACKWSNLELDEADRYHCLLRNNYDFFGKPFEDRVAEYYKIHTNADGKRELPPEMEVMDNGIDE